MDEVEKKITEWVEEALELRHGDAGDPDGKIQLPEYQDGPAPVLASLLRVRARLDRLEELQAKMTQAKARIVRARDQAKFDSEIAMDTAYVANAGRRHTTEFSSAAERKADATLDSINEKRAAAQAERRVSLATEAFEIINRAYWGMNSVRDDHVVMLRTKQFESSLER